MTQITASMVKELREISSVGMMECKKALVETQGDMDAAKELLRKTGQVKALKKSSRETREGGVGIAIASDKKKAALVKIACETDFVAKNEKFRSLLGQLAEQAITHGVEDFMNQPFQQQADLEGTVQDMLMRFIGELGENIQFLEAKALQVDFGVVGGYVHMTGKIGVLVALKTEQPVEHALLDPLAKDISMHIAASQAEAISEDQIPAEALEKEKEIFVAQARDSGRPEKIIEQMIAGRMRKFKKEICVLSQPFVKIPEQTIEELLSETSKTVGVGIALTDFVKFQF
jgi:elongation factor Ts